MSQFGFALTLLFSSIFFYFAISFFPKARTLLITSGFLLLLIGFYSLYANWLPQYTDYFRYLPIKKLTTAQIMESMPSSHLANLGRSIIFDDSIEMKGAGKGQCPLCHAFKSGVLSERAPNLFGIVKRAGERIKEPDYLHPDTVQFESFPGSGRATTADEYIAESHICPSCYVVKGYGLKGTHDRKSGGPVINKEPISLSIDEMVAIHTFLYVNDGIKSPPPSKIRAAYEKFIPINERISPDSLEAHKKERPNTAIIAFDSDTPLQIVQKMGCSNCHQIPGIPWKSGMMGPILIEKVLAPKRLASLEYQARVKVGKAHASSPKEYVIESIISPNNFVSPAFINNSNSEQSIMYFGYDEKFTYRALEKLVDFLLTLDCDSARKEGLTGPPTETVTNICG